MWKVQYDRSFLRYTKHHRVQLVILTPGASRQVSHHKTQHNLRQLTLYHGQLSHWTTTDPRSSFRHTEHAPEELRILYRAIPTWHRVQRAAQRQSRHPTVSVSFGVLAQRGGTTRRGLQRPSIVFRMHCVRGVTGQDEEDESHVNNEEVE
jgi:hypothetical protein